MFYHIISIYPAKELISEICWQHERIMNKVLLELFTVLVHANPVLWPFPDHFFACMCNSAEAPVVSRWTGAFGDHGLLEVHVHDQRLVLLKHCTYLFQSVTNSDLWDWSISFRKNWLDSTHLLCFHSIWCIGLRVHIAWWHSMLFFWPRK